jgi:hypothetical protein
MYLYMYVCAYLGVHCAGDFHSISNPLKFVCMCACMYSMCLPWHLLYGRLPFDFEPSESSNFHRWAHPACVYVCMYVCVCVCMHGGLVLILIVGHTLHMCVCVYGCMYVCMDVCMDVCMSYCMDGCMSCSNLHRWAHPALCVHCICIHTHTHMLF